MIEYIQVGKIINTHGIKGEVKVLPLTDDITRFEDLSEIYIEDEKLIIEKVGYKKGLVILKFKNYNNINDVIKFKDKFILIDRKEAIELPKDTYFIFELIGLQAYTMDGENIGEIVDILQTGANDVYVVKKGKKEYLIPAIKEIVKEVNLDEGKILIDPIEGLIE